MSKILSSFVKTSAMRLILLTCGLLILGGCQNLYESSRINAEQQCRKLPPSEWDDCLSRVNRQPYAEYEKARQSN